MNEVHLFSPPPPQPLPTLTQNTSSVPISVIIPVYNVEQYITECLESLINQTFSNIEIICVDDGSTDKSADYILEYAKRDSRVILLQQENLGPSKARNVGIEHSKSPYIMFCDPDDYYVPHAIELLYTKMTAHNVDMVSGKFYIQNEYKENEVTVKQEETTTPPIEGICEIGIRDFSVTYLSQCAKLYKRSLIEQYALRFSEHIFLGEDLHFVSTYLTIAQRVYYLQEPIYYYRLRKHSATYIQRNEEIPFSSIIQPMQSMEEVMLFMKKHNVLDKYITMVAYTYLQFFHLALQKSKDCDIPLLYIRAKGFWSSIEGYISYIDVAQTLDEVYAIRQGRYFHSLLLEHKKVVQNIDYLYSHSFLATLKYIRYFIFSHLPIKRKEYYAKKYKLLKEKRTSNKRYKL